MCFPTRPSEQPSISYPDRVMMLQSQHNLNKANSIPSPDLALFFLPSNPTSPFSRVHPTNRPKSPRRRKATLTAAARRSSQTRRKGKPQPRRSLATSGVRPSLGRPTPIATTSFRSATRGRRTSLCVHVRTAVCEWGGGEGRRQ